MESNKPLIRWIMGPANANGFKCLGESVDRMNRIYPECDLLICHNQLNHKQLEEVKKCGVPLYDQMQSINALSIGPKGGYQVHWKLYPPRLAHDRHEIVIDNDVVFLKRLNEIDKFLDGDYTIMCHGLNGLHGKFHKHVPAGVRVNSGVFGMPPGFDFCEVMKEHIPATELTSWENRFDEQGLVAAVLNKYSRRIFIPVTTLPIVQSGFDLDGLTTDACCGYHFVGLNYDKQHEPWERHRAKDKKIML